MHPDDVSFPFENQPTVVTMSTGRLEWSSTSLVP
jgi:hypothetical protein